MPPLLRYFDRFQYKRIIDFLRLLDNKFSADWINQYSPTDRIEAMNQVIKVIDEAKDVADVFDSGCFNIDSEELIRLMDSPVYGRRFARYLLMKLDFRCTNHHQRMNFEILSVEIFFLSIPKRAATGQLISSPRSEQSGLDKLGNLVLYNEAHEFKARTARLSREEKKIF